MKKATTALIVGGAAALGLTAFAMTAKAAPKKLPKPGKSPRTPKIPGKPGEQTVDGTKVRRPVAPNPQEAQWADLEQSVALLSQDAQWRFAIPDDRASMFPPGQDVTVRVDGANGLTTSSVEATDGGFNVITRTGPTVTFNREAGVLQVYPAKFAGRIIIESGGLPDGMALTAWVLSPEAKVTTFAGTGLSKHVIDQRVDGVWQAHAFVIDDDGTLVEQEAGEFLDEAEAIAWADTWLDARGSEAA